MMRDKDKRRIIPPTCFRFILILLWEIESKLKLDIKLEKNDNFVKPKDTFL